MKDLELTGTCPLTGRHPGSEFEEYQLPTQKHREQQSRTTTSIHSRDCNLSSKKVSCKKDFRVSDKILRLYNTPIEREIPSKRARSVAKNARNSRDNSCFQNETSFSFLEHNNSNNNSTQMIVNILQLSSNTVNESVKTSRILTKYTELSPLPTTSLKSVATEDPCLIKDRPCVSQSKKLKALNKIRPCHPQFAKEITVKPEDALKINALILGERLQVQITPTLPNVTFPCLGNPSQSNTTTPKYWWKYLNQKIAQKMSTPLPCLNKMCKLCELNSEQKVGIVKQSELGKNMLHIDLKRLAEVRTKDWSSYGHYTKVHKLKYTKRRKNLWKSKEKHVEVDEDYLNIDVDTLMDIYEQKSITDVTKSNYAGEAAERNNHESKKDSQEEHFTCQGNYAHLQRPTTTKLRSCVNITSRKTCFTNVL